MRLSILLLMLGVAGCNCGQQGPCTDDAQCDATGQGFSKCDKDAGVCICVDARACGPNEFCNGAGRCQAESGCSTNEDCGTSPGLFCDVTTSECLSVEECNPQNGQVCCVLDDQCPFNNICDVVTRTCVPGCRDTGDCILGQGCLGAGFGRLGQCGISCTADNLCPFGDLCNLGTNACEQDTRGPYCGSCTGGVASDDCGSPGNYCLIDEFNAGAEFCGVDCAGGQACPNGYGCQQVIIIPSNTGQCSGSETCTLPAGICSRTGASCARDEDCPQGPPGGDCPQIVAENRKGACTADPSVPCNSDADCAAGGCTLIECRASEGATSAFCSCTRDSDCPSDTCKDADLSDPQHQVLGHCELSGHACFEDAECDIIACVEGGCLIGSNCAPSNDRSCADLQQTTTTTP